MTDRGVEALFDRVAGTYETNRLGGWYRAHGRFIADQLSDRRFRAAVDVGCGTGWLLRELVRRGIARQGIGLDLSRAMVSEAWARAEGALEFHRCRWPAVPEEVAALLERTSPDLLVFASSLHYMPDAVAALTAARKTLTPGGTLAILERAPERSFLTRLWGRVHELLLRDGAAFVATPVLHERLRAAGFEEVATRARLERRLWRGKLITSMALSTARAPRSPS